MTRLRRQERYGFADDGSETARALRGRLPERTLGWVRARLMVVGPAVILLAILAISLVKFVGVASVLPYRAGWAGVPGTASLVVCSDGGVPSGPVTCYATFGGDDGRRQVDEAVIEGRHMVPVQDYSARLHPDGRTISLVTPADLLNTLGELFGLFVGIVVAAGLLYVGLHSTARRWLGRPTPRTYQRHLWTIAVTSGVAGVAAVALYLAALAAGG